MVWLTLLGVLIVAVGIYMKLRPAKPQTSTPPAEDQEPSTLSLAEAKSKAEALLASGSPFVVSKAGSIGAEFARLGPMTREFFQRYPHLRSNGTELGADLAKKSTYRTGFISIGQSEDWDIVQWPGEDRVFVLEGGESTDADMDTRFPTIYHFVVDEAGLRAK